MLHAGPGAVRQNERRDRVIGTLPHYRSLTHANNRIMPPRMAHPVTLSKTKLLAHAQCARKLWLAQYRPELEDATAIDEAALERARVVAARARDIYGPGHHIAPERGLRAAIAATRDLIAAGGTTPIFDATFEHAGVTFQVDILDRSRGTLRAIEVKSSTEVKKHHLTDCAIQAWGLDGLGLLVGEIVIAHVDPAFVDTGDGDYSRLLVERNVTDEIGALREAIPALAAKARATLEAHEEPSVQTGAHCHTPHACPFFAHCAPAPR
jgi:hypothetical protein